MQTVDDSINTSIPVGGLNDSVSIEQLRQIFSPYGQLVHVKVLVGEGCGFVQFADSHCAEVALKMLNGTQLGGQNIRLSWGRSPSNEQTQLDPNQWNSGSYGYQRGYETGGCVRSIQGPNMYYGSYLDMEIASKPPNSSRSSSISSFENLRKTKPNKKYALCPRFGLARRILFHHPTLLRLQDLYISSPQGTSFAPIDTC